MHSLACKYLNAITKCKMENTVHILDKILAFYINS